MNQANTSVSQTPKTAGVEHKENGVICFFDKSHKNKEYSTQIVDRQVSHRASVLIAFTIPAMSKIQQNENYAGMVSVEQVVRKAFALSGVFFGEDDLDRSLNALPDARAELQARATARATTTAQPATATADTSDSVATWINQMFASGMAETEIIELMKSQQWKEENLIPYFKSLQPEVPTAPSVPVPPSA